MKIYVDADGSPVVNLSISLAKDYNLDIIVVKNHAHNIEDDYATIVTVDVINDGADFYIVNNLKKDDIVITQDYGLAALCLAKGALCINQNGQAYTNDNINSLLSGRYINAKLRQQGKRHSNARKRSKQDDIDFIDGFDNLIIKQINKRKNSLSL